MLRQLWASEISLAVTDDQLLDELRRRELVALHFELDHLGFV